MSNKALFFFVVACASVMCTKTYTTPPQPSSATKSHSKKTSTDKTSRQRKGLKSGSSSDSEARSLTKFPTLKVSTLTAERIAIRADQAAKNGAHNSGKASAKKYNARIRSHPDLEHLAPMLTKKPKAPPAHAEKRPKRRDTSSEFTDVVDTPREIIVGRFRRAVLASATGHIPGDEESFKERFATATSLTPRSVDAHMEHLKATASHAREAIAAASAIDTKGMTQAKLQEHIKTLRERFGEAAEQGISNLRRRKKESSPGG